MRRWLLVLGLLLLLTVFAAWQVPAGWALKLARASEADLSWATASGSAWRGQAQSLYWRGLALGTVDWRLLGLRGWTGPRTEWSIEGRSTQYAVQGRLSFEGGVLYSIELLQGRMPAAWIDISHALPLIYLTGTLELDLARIRFRNRVPTGGEGIIRWQDAGLGGLVRESLGTVEFELRPSRAGGDSLEFVFASLGDADILAAGEGSLRNNQYDVRVRVSVAEERDDLRRALSAAGQAAPDGTIAFEWHGDLFP